MEQLEQAMGKMFSGKKGKVRAFKEYKADSVLRLAKAALAGGKGGKNVVLGQAAAEALLQEKKTDALAVLSGEKSAEMVEQQANLLAAAREGGGRWLKFMLT